MNDNQTPASAHHQACLTLLQNLREQLDCADRAGVQCSPGQDVFTSEHFQFWREQIDLVLTLPAAALLAAGAAPCAHHPLPV